MTEGAAEKFDWKTAREIAEYSHDSSELRSELRSACDRIEALEKLVELASAWLIADDDSGYPETNAARNAREAYRALVTAHTSEGSV